MRIALTCMDQKWKDKPGNLALASVIVAEAAAVGAEMLVLPEMTLTGFSMDIQDIAEDSARSDTVEAFAALAIRHGIHIVFGVVFANGDKASNTLIHMSPRGDVLARYAKIHPFTFAGEGKRFIPGDHLASASVGGLTFGYGICYDLRFPELYSAMSKSCDVLVTIANWPARRVHHWRALLFARAIENQAFVLGVNRVGVDGNGLEYEKSTMAINADGRVMQPVLSQGCFDLFDIEPSDLAKFRGSFSTLPDRRPALYKNIL